MHGKTMLSPKMTKLLLHSSCDNENCKRASNAIPYQPYPYLSGSAFLVKIELFTFQKDFLFALMKPFKNDGKYFLFCSLDI